MRHVPKSMEVTLVVNDGITREACRGNSYNRNIELNGSKTPLYKDKNSIAANG